VGLNDLLRQHDLIQQHLHALSLSLLVVLHFLGGVLDGVDGAFNVRGLLHHVVQFPCRVGVVLLRLILHFVEDHHLFCGQTAYMGGQLQDGLVQLVFGVPQQAFKLIFHLFTLLQQLVSDEILHHFQVL